MNPRMQAKIIMLQPAHLKVTAQNFSHSSKAVCEIITRDATPLDQASMTSILIHKIINDARKNHSEEEQTAFVRIFQEMLLTITNTEQTVSVEKKVKK